MIFFFCRLTPNLGCKYHSINQNNPETKREMFIDLSIRFYKKLPKPQSLKNLDFLIPVLFNTVSFCSRSRSQLLSSLPMGNSGTWTAGFSNVLWSNSAQRGRLPPLSVFSKCSSWEGSALSDLRLTTNCCINHKCAICTLNSGAGFKLKVATLHSEVY